jgi:CheY-like chemotaxis protein
MNSKILRISSDDEKPFRSILCGCAAPELYSHLHEALSACADEVVYVEFGRRCFDLAMKRSLDNNPFDLIALDVELPRIGGYSVTALLRENGYTGTVISMSPVDMPFYEFDSERCGCDLHLSGKNLSKRLPKIGRAKRLLSIDHTWKMSESFKKAVA